VIGVVHVHVSGGQNDTPFGQKTPGRPNVVGVLTHIYLLDNGSGWVVMGRVGTVARVGSVGQVTSINCLHQRR
jgi:hypothetical protein